MRLSKVYCNLPDLFGPIEFNLGKDDSALNIILASVTRPKDSTRDSHNLGKSSLIHVIDFVLLKSVNEDNSFLIKHRDRFDNFVFFGEFLADSGNFITVRRSVALPTRSSLRIRPVREYLTDLEDESWDHPDVPEATGRQLLDSYLDLTAISPWEFRKGVTYFLRSQQDYNDYFQIAKFARGADANWKPYLAKVFGFPYEIIEKKYEIDIEIAHAQVSLRDFESSATISLEDIGKLRVQIATKEGELAEVRKRVDAFSFSDEETRLTGELAGSIERDIARINGELYNLTLDLTRARDSIQAVPAVDVDKVAQLYEDASVYLPEKLFHDYSELVDFVRKITKDRNRQLKKQIGIFEEKIAALEAQKVELDRRRQDALSVIRDIDTLRKYKALQTASIGAEADLRVLRVRLDQLEHAKTAREKIKNLQATQRELQDKIETFPESGPQKYLAIARVFHSLVKLVLGIEGNFYIRANKAGNIEYRIETEESTPGNSVQVTSQSRGTSYKKLLCALFDLSVLAAYHKERFFHFAYHDGILEGLDNRKKISYLNQIRKTTSDLHLQYILTVIESDLPRDPEDNPITFGSSEVILRLSDAGDEGRLFRMAKF